MLRRTADRARIHWPSVENPAWHFVYETRSGGALHYFGASHSDDPSHPQFDEIEAVYAEMKPTVVFYEGPSRPIGDSRDDTIKKFGESGYLRYLATENNADIRRLEPSPIDENRRTGSHLPPKTPMADSPTP